MACEERPTGHVLTSDGNASAWQPVPEPNLDDIHAMMWMEVSA